MACRNYYLIILLILILFLVSFSANPLANLPSTPDAAHIAKIQAMGDNTWLDLGSPAADPVWGECRGRSWGARQAYAPDLEGAFFCGEGPHGYVKPDGHYLDDLWFYDANQHKWICAYPGTHCSTLDLHLDANGFEVDASGDLVPVAYIPHTYGNVTYIPTLQRYMVEPFWDPKSFWEHCCPQRSNWLTSEWIGGSYLHPMYWDVDAGKWERPISTGPGPLYEEGCLLQYIPALNKVFFNHVWKNVWLYDPVNLTWEKIHTSSNFFANQLGCYDSKRNHVYGARSSDMAYFDFTSNTWTMANNGGRSFPSTNSLALNYDSVNDIIFYHNAQSSNSGIWGAVSIYDPAQDSWQQMANTFPSGVSTGYRNQNSFYDPKLNVHFVYIAMDGADNGTMLAYRYKKEITNASMRIHNNKEADIMVFPNPVSYSTVIQITRGQRSEDRGQIAEINILNISGKVVYQLTSDLCHLTSGLTLNPGRLPCGVYILKIKSFSKEYSKRLFVY
jgi:hypothetical protein